MRESVKKIVLALSMASVILFSATAFATSTDGTQRTTTTISANDTVSSASDETGTADETDSTAETDTTTDGTESTRTTAGNAAAGVVQDSSVPVPTAISTGQQQSQTNVVQQTEASRDAEKRYASKGSLAVWIIITILLNIIISFVIGNRFYKLAKKDTHVSAEIRALRRDLEEKFVNNVGGFTEMETDVTNTNDNYSMNGSIRMPERKSTDFASESEDVFKRWESQMSQRRAARRTVAEPVVDDEIEEEEDEERYSRRKFQPTRAQVEEHDDVDEYADEEEDEEDTRQKTKSVKNKAKSILGDIFPFKED